MDMESVTYAYISEPVEFRQLEGKAIDFRKTFDVRGRGTDEMLQLYLRKAHLPDDVEDLPAMQRRAYVYDIIRSNKAPGYWVPRCMQVSSDVFSQPPPAVLPPPSTRSTPGSERRILDDGYSLKMSHSSSSNSLNSFKSAPGAVPGPSFGTSVLVSNKGSKYEISGPVNFQHVSGDVLRDRTRNAFDLSAGANDNVLKKYMMEHGITDEDIAGMKRQEVIMKIMHSNFTWLPNKQELEKPKTSPKTLQYATISTNNQITPPPSPPPQSARHPPAQATPFSNYASLTSRFVDISDMEMVQPTSRQQEMGTVVPVQLQQAQPNAQKVPPPPSAVTAANTRPATAALEVRPAKPKTSTETYATIAPQTQRKTATMRVPPPAPPKPSIVPSTNASTVQYAPVKQPPPPPPIKTSSIQQRNEPMQPRNEPVPNRFNESVQSRNEPVQPRKEPVANRNEHVPNRFAPVQPRYESVQSHNEPVPNRFAPVPQQSKTAAGSANAAIPPPPPPPPIVAAQSGAPPPPPPPPAAGTGPPMPPPPPPAGGASRPLVIKKSEQPKAEAAGGDDRDAFLESIRKGVQLKKVDKKAATISGIKPRAEKKPATTDFLSELKLGITLRRVKNPADNPYSAENTDESLA
ncbi:hypothetical protein ACLKA7_010808 [Drosophila subpalustris]